MDVCVTLVAHVTDLSMSRSDCRGVTSGPAEYIPDRGTCTRFPSYLP